MGPMVMRFITQQEMQSQKVLSQAYIQYLCLFPLIKWAQHVHAPVRLIRMNHDVHLCRSIDLDEQTGNSSVPQCLGGIQTAFCCLAYGPRERAWVGIRLSCMHSPSVTLHIPVARCGGHHGTAATPGPPPRILPPPLRCSVHPQLHGLCQAISFKKSRASAHLGGQRKGFGQGPMEAFLRKSPGGTCIGCFTKNAQPPNHSRTDLLTDHPTHPPTSSFTGSL